MKVFRACVIIIRRHIVSLGLYFGIFLALSVVMPALSAEQYGMADFSAMKPNFTVIDRDGGTPLSEGLRAYLSRHGSEVILEDRKDALQDASFFHATDYIVIVPQGFHDAFFGGREAMTETVVTTESAKGYYADGLVTQYLNQARLLKTAGNLDEETLVSMALDNLSIEAGAEIKRFEAGAPVDQVYHIYYRMGSYIVMVLIILCISNIMSSFRRPDLRMRNLCAPMKPRAMSLQQMLCGVLVSIAAYVLLTALGFGIYGPKLAGVDGRIIGLILLNFFVVTLVALSVASLAGLFIKGPNSQNAVANFASLGLGFLGGVFVPLDMLGEGILAAARFTPIYWYSQALDHICALASFSGDALAPIWRAMLTQLIFAGALFCLTLVAGKHLNQSERSFGSVRTELDA